MSETDYGRATRAAGLLELPGEAVVRVEGKGARSFLQRLLTNDVLALEVGQGRRALLLDVKGHVRADLAVLRVGDDALLALAPPVARADTVKMLSLYGIADELEVTDETEAARLYTLQGPRAGEAITALAPGPLTLARALDHVVIPLEGGATARLVRHDRSGLGGFDLIVPAAGAAPGVSPPGLGAIERAVASVGGGAIGQETLELIRVESLVPRFGVDFGTETIPQEAHLHETGADALSFTKGCFLGQEVVARLKFRGHVNKLLVSLALDAPVAPGSPIRKEGKDVGRVTSSVRSPRRASVVGLGYVRREHAAEGTAVEVAGEGGQTVRATVSPHPLASGS